MTEKRYQPIDFSSIKDILSVLFKRKYTILAVFLIVFGSVFLYALLAPRVFEAKSILLVKLGREFMRTSEGTGSTSGLLVQPETILKSEISILTSKDLITRVIETVGLQNIYPGLKKTDQKATQTAILSFEQDLSVVNVPNSGLIQVAFAHSDPATAAQVVNTLVEKFKDKHLDVFGGKTTAFLERQEKAFQQRLRESENNLSEYKQKNKVFSYDEQKTSLVNSLAALDGRSKVAQNEVTELEGKIAFIQSPRWTVDLPSETRIQLLNLQQKEQGLLEKYTETSRAVISVRQELSALKESIRKNHEESRQIELGKVQGQLAAARARAGSIGAQMRATENELRSLDNHGREFQALKRDTVQLEQNHQIYARKLEESLIMDDMDRQKMVAVSVVQKATVPAFPKKQKVTRSAMVAGGFFGGIAAGVALAIALELMTPGMPTPASAERTLGVPVLVSVMRKE
ncbi:MAG: lipopolysaccharide biosynthesis [Deltaproteobacteria bacterium]|nr:lipopolysaccharide biosynthesis [Deltaproteobacteria bacterium]